MEMSFGEQQVLSTMLEKAGPFLASLSEKFAGKASEFLGDDARRILIRKMKNGEIVIFVLKSDSVYEINNKEVRLSRECIEKMISIKDLVSMLTSEGIFK